MAIVPISDKPMYVFDLDGTLALTDHRLHFITTEGQPKNHEAFEDACDKDAPNTEIIEFARVLAGLGADLRIVTGRSDRVKAKTVEWLAEHAGFFKYSQLVMRKTGDRRKDYEIKQEWLNSLRPVDRNRIRAVFEDRTRVVEMWRSNGLICLQVSAGNF